MIFVLRETSAKALLEKRAQKTRNRTGDSRYTSILDDGVSPGQAFSRAIKRPLRLLVLHPIVLILSSYFAVIYGYLVSMFLVATVHLTDVRFSTFSSQHCRWYSLESTASQLAPPASPFWGSALAPLLARFLSPSGATGLLMLWSKRMVSESLSSACRLWRTLFR